MGDSTSNPLLRESNKALVQVLKLANITFTNMSTQKIELIFSYDFAPNVVSISHCQLFSFTRIKICFLVTHSLEKLIIAYLA